MQAQEVLKKYFACMKNQDDAIFDLIDENSTFIAVRPAPIKECDLYGTFIGKAGFIKFRQNLVNAFETKKFEIHSIIGNENEAAAFGYFEHIIKNTNKLFCSNWALNLKTENGKIVLYRFYEDTGELERCYN